MSQPENDEILCLLALGDLVHGIVEADVLAVHVAEDAGRPQRVIERRVELLLRVGGAARHADRVEAVVPGAVGLRAHAVEVPAAIFRVEVGLRVGDTDVGDADLHLHRQARAEAELGHAVRDRGRGEGPVEGRIEVDRHRHRVAAEAAAHRAARDHAVGHLRDRAGGGGLGVGARGVQHQQRGLAGRVGELAEAGAQGGGQLHLDLRIEQHRVVARLGRFVRMTEGGYQLGEVGGGHHREFAVVAAAAGTRHVRHAEALDRVDVVVVAGRRARLLAVVRRRRGVGVGRPLHHARRQAGGRLDTAGLPAGTGFGELLASVPISGSTYWVRDRLRLSSRLVVSARRLTDAPPVSRRRHRCRRRLPHTRSLRRPRPVWLRAS